MQRSFKREFDSLNDVFPFISEFLDAEKIGEGVAFSINLAVEELFTNMVKYNTGSGNEISISVSKKGDTLVLDLVDFDVDPFDFDTAEEVQLDKPIEDRQPGGLGLHLVKSVMDKVTYEYANRRMKVTVIKRLGS